MALSGDLISLWELEEASGTRTDSHGANHLTDNNTVLQGTGKVANCADFEESNGEYLSRADNTELSTGDIDFMIAFWVNLETVTNGRAICSKWNGGTGNAEWICWQSGGPASFQFLVSSDGTSISASVDSGVNPTPSTWYFVVCWHDATANTINIQVNNATPVSTAHSGGVRDGTAAFELGSFEAGGNNLDGLLDQFGFWKRVLTSDERTDLYNAGAGRSYAYISGWTSGIRIGRSRRQRAGWSVSSPGGFF